MNLIFFLNLLILFLANDLANRWTDTVLLYSNDSYRHKEGLYLFLGSLPPPSTKETPEKSHHPKRQIFRLKWKVKGLLKKKHKLSAASLQFDKLSYGPRQGWTRRFFHSLKHAPGRLGRPQGAESGPAGWRAGHDLQKCRLTGIQQFQMLFIFPLKIFIFNLKFFC